MKVNVSKWSRRLWKFHHFIINFAESLIWNILFVTAPKMWRNTAVSHTKQHASPHKNCSVLPAVCVWWVFTVSHARWCWSLHLPKTKRTRGLLIGTNITGVSGEMFNLSRKCNACSGYRNNWLRMKVAPPHSYETINGMQNLSVSCPLTLHSSLNMAAIRNAEVGTKSAPLDVRVLTSCVCEEGNVATPWRRAGSSEETPCILNPGTR
jgi:hypothetical protein